MAAALRDADKLSRIGKVEALKESIRAEFTEEEQAAWEREIPVALKKLEKKAMRTMVVETGERVDGRAADEIRPIMVKDNYLPLVHGSGLFQRGQTQVLSVLSLGMLNEGQRLDTIEPTEGKRYMHHYNFPPFCTGETGRMGSPQAPARSATATWQSAPCFRCFPTRTSSPTPSAWSPRSWSPTAPLRWLRPAAPRSPLWTAACPLSARSPVSPWA